MVACARGGEPKPEFPKSLNFRGVKIFEVLSVEPRFAARNLGVELTVEWIRGVNNPADRFTVAKGYKGWRDNDLKALALRP